MMRLRSHTSADDDFAGKNGQVRRREPTGVPPKAQKLLGEKGQVGFNIEESIIISGGGSPHDDGIDVPPKAQKVLGERAKVRDVRVQNARHADPDSLWHVRDAERQRSIGNSDNTSYADSDTVPRPRKSAPLPQYPAALRSSENVRPSSNGSTIPTGTSSRGTRHQPSGESLSREYYDATKQPPLVSQQTSESSVRDMALRKGATTGYEISSEVRLTTPQSQHSASRQPLPDRSVSDGAPRQQKKTGLRSLLPHSRSDGRAGGGGKFARPPPSASPASSESLSRDGGRAFRMVSRQSNEPSSGKARNSHTNLYDNRKTNVRRPPKGIKNWFDGFDISSDEEEGDAVELPAVQLGNKQGPSAVQEALPSVFSLYGPPTQDYPAPAYVSSKALPASDSSIVYNNTAVSKSQTTRKNSQGSTTAESASSGAIEGRKRSGESRLARSRLGAQSVLSLSSGSDDEVRPPRPPAERDSVGNSTIVNDRATSFDLHRVATPTGALGQSHTIEQAASNAKVRRTNSYSSGPRSNPFGDSSTNYNSTPGVASREAGSMFSGSSSNARRWQYGWNGYRRSNIQSPYERDGGESAGGETSSSVPTDASRLMAVTEEEMILLELMRQKRAAMQKHSFAEGYRLARRQGEQLHYHPSQDLTTDPALLVLRKRAGRRTTGRGLSRTEGLIREELEQRKRLSALRKEEVDKAFKIGRFLEMESPADEDSSKMDRFLVMAPGLAGDFSGRPVSGTEIEIDSRYGENEDGTEEIQSSFDEGEEFPDARLDREEDTEYSRNHSEADEADEADEAEETSGAGTPQPIISPMQRLTDQVRLAGNDGMAAKAVLIPIDPKREGLVGDASVVETPSLLKQLSSGRENLEGEAARGKSIEDKSQAHTIPARTPISRDFPPLQLESQEPGTGKSQGTEIDSPDTPVATTWARPTSLKHPRPQRRQPVLDFTPLEHQPMRPKSSSSAVDQALSPAASFESAANPPLAGPMDEGIPVASPQHGSHQFDSDLPNPLRSHPPGGVDLTRMKRAAPPPRINTVGQGGNPSGKAMASITSAGEDVLAAWAELGGGNEFRRKRDW